MFILIFAFLTQMPWAAAAPSKMIGFTALEQKILSRVYEAPQGQLLTMYGFTQPPFSFVQQLGFYEPGSYNIKNAEPNSFNMVLLSFLMDRIAQDLAQICNTTPFKTFAPLKPSMDKALRAFCTWPAPSALEQKNFDQFLLAMTVVDLSGKEQTAWKQHFQSPSQLTKPREQILYEMSYSLLMNPYFLLKK